MSLDDSKVYVTNIGIGTVDTVDATIVTAPGAITEFDTDTLRLGAIIGFSGVALTQMMNFYDNCSAYVAGFNGNAQRFTFDNSCVVGDPASQSGAAPEAALAQTGVNGAAISGLSGGGALAALLGITIVAAPRRRHAQK